MKLTLSYLRAMITIIAVTALTTALAAPPVPITADEAFDAVQMQIDPLEGTVAKVLLVDLRDPVEYFWSGAPAEVTGIHLLDEKKEAIAPDWGKVRLVHEGKFIEYSQDGRYKRTLVAKISHLETEPIAANIPFKFKIGTPPGWEVNPDFTGDIEGLSTSYDVLILYCRTGGRSSAATLDFDTTLFSNVYEIDDPDGANMYGGFSGSKYQGSYNGYVGFPDRLTDGQDHPSVSWSDSGLPIATTVKPIPPPEP